MPVQDLSSVRSGHAAPLRLDRDAWTRPHFMHSAWPPQHRKRLVTERGCEAVEIYFFSVDSGMMAAVAAAVPAHHQLCFLFQMALKCHGVT